MLSKPLGFPMNRNLLGFGMIQGTVREKKCSLGEGFQMIGRGELWHTKEEEKKHIELQRLMLRWFCLITAKPEESEDDGSHLTFTAGPAVASSTGTIYSVNSQFGSSNHFLLELLLPTDICSLSIDSQSCLNSPGCAVCVVRESKEFFCYSNSGPRPQGLGMLKSHFIFCIVMDRQLSLKVICLPYTVG